LTRPVTVIGGGLAGSEAAWQLARAGVPVRLVEMRPVRPTLAHHTDKLAELVCSNSLGSRTEGTAAALLKAEMRLMDSLVMRAAEQAAVPAGGALAVDRDVFSEAIMAELLAHPHVELVREEQVALDPEAPTLIATGPLTSEALSAELSRHVGHAHLHFYDAAAPILVKDSLDMAVVFPQARYDKGDGVYLNCPMDRDQYLAFHEALVGAEGAVLHLGETERNFFESCLPVEVLGRRGVDTLRFGPMKPVGLTDPRTGRRPYAVVQLRQDNVVGDLYNMVGFQTQLKWGEQTRVFRMIPGMERAEFVRMGVMHRNTYLASPAFLAPTLQWRDRPQWFVAGCLVGVEGYSESAASGALAGLNLARVLRGQDPIVLPRTSMLGALMHYVTHADPARFQPMNSNWGLLEPPAGPRIRDKVERHRLMGERGLGDLRAALAGALATLA